MGCAGRARAVRSLLQLSTLPEEPPPPGPEGSQESANLVRGTLQSGLPLRGAEAARPQRGSAHVDAEGVI